jgi:hypothetical protein
LPTYNPSTGKAESGGWRVRGQTELHRETLSQNKTKKMFTENFSEKMKPSKLRE